MRRAHRHRALSRVPTGTTLVVALVATFVAASTAGAQSAAVCPARGSLPAPNDTLEATLHLWLDPDKRVTAGERAVMDAQLQEIALRFRNPPALTIPPTLAVATSDSALQSSGRLLDVRVNLVIDRAGALRRTEVVGTSGAPGLTTALLAAIRATDSASAFGALPDFVRHDSLLLRLRAGPRPAAGVAVVPLMRIAVPYVRLDRPADKRGGRLPEYPIAARNANIQESILMQFVVDEDGRADMSTARFLRGHYREFAEAVLAVLPGWRFEPARLGACPVRQVVQLPFEFRLRH